MASFIEFNEGGQAQATGGWPSTFTFHLSTKKVASGDFSASNTLGGGFGIATGTGYTSKTQSRPSPSGIGSLAFTILTWNTSSATDWPAGVKSIVATDGTHLLWAEDLSTTRDMSAANTVLNVTPTYTKT